MKKRLQGTKRTGITEVKEKVMQKQRRLRIGVKSK